MHAVWEEVQEEKGRLAQARRSAVGTQGQHFGGTQVEWGGSSGSKGEWSSGHAFRLNPEKRGWAGVGGTGPTAQQRVVVHLGLCGGLQRRGCPTPPRRGSPGSPRGAAPRLDGCSSQDGRPWACRQRSDRASEYLAARPAQAAAWLAACRLPAGEVGNSLVEGWVPGKAKASPRLLLLRRLLLLLHRQVRRLHLSQVSRLHLLLLLLLRLREHGRQAGRVAADLGRADGVPAGSAAEGAARHRLL